MADEMPQTHATQKLEEKAQEKKGETIEERKKEALKADAKTEAKAAEKKAEPKKAEEKKEVKKREIVLERVFTVPFRSVFKKARNLRYPAAMRFLRAFAQRHFKTPDVKINAEVASAVRNEHGATVVQRLKIKATKDKEGIVVLELQK